MEEVYVKSVRYFALLTMMSLGLVGCFPASDSASEKRVEPGPTVDELRVVQENNSEALEKVIAFCKANIEISALNVDGISTIYKDKGSRNVAALERTVPLLQVIGAETVHCLRDYSNGHSLRWVDFVMWGEGSALSASKSTSLRYYTDENLRVLSSQESEESLGISGWYVRRYATNR